VGQTLPANANLATASSTAIDLNKLEGTRTNCRTEVVKGFVTGQHVSDFTALAGIGKDKDHRQGQKEGPLGT